MICLILGSVNITTCLLADNAETLKNKDDRVYNIAPPSISPLFHIPRPYPVNELPYPSHLSY
jgi:hypothetical protein